MKEYNVLNNCLSILKSSRMDVMTKLRMENLLIAIKMLLLVDAANEETMLDLEELLNRVNEVCAGDSPDGVKGLLDHIRKMRTSMAACLNLAA